MPIPTATTYFDDLRRIPSRDSISRPVVAQVITIANATGGSFVVAGLRPDTSAVGMATLNYNVDAGTAQTLLESIYGAGNVLPTSGGTPPIYTLTLSFVGTLAGFIVPNMTIVDNTTGSGHSVTVSPITTGRGLAGVNQYLNAEDYIYMTNTIWPMYADRNLIDPERAVRGPYLQYLYTGRHLIGYLKRKIWQDITYQNDGLNKSKEQYLSALKEILGDFQEQITVIETRANQNRPAVVGRLIYTAPYTPRCGQVNPNASRFRGGDVGRPDDWDDAMLGLP